MEELKKRIEEDYLKSILEIYELDFEDEVSEENQYLLNYMKGVDSLDHFVERAAEIRAELDKTGDGVNLDSLSPLFSYAERIARETGRYKNELLYGCVIMGNS